MHGFLKCFYGFKNLGDELLFRGVIDYIDIAYREVDELTVQVADVHWMEEWWEKNIEFIGRLWLAKNFCSQKKKIHFVALSKNIMDNFSYDLYFFWWWEVFAESRGIHWGWNYLIRYCYPIVQKKFVLIGGMESAKTWRQQLLYRIVLPRAQKIVTREEMSYHEVKQYTDKVEKRQDFAVPLIDAYRQKITGQKLQSFQIEKPYVIINIVASQSTEESYEKIRRFLTILYPDATPVYISWKSINSNDENFAQWLEGAYPNLYRYHWEEHTISELFALINGATAGIASRLHILLLLQEFQKPRYALSYAEKVDKLITSTIDL